MSFSLLFGQRTFAIFSFQTCFFVDINSKQSDYSNSKHFQVSHSGISKGIFTFLLIKTKILIDFIFQNNFQFTVKWNQDMDISHLPSATTHAGLPPIISRQSSGMFIIIGDPQLTHHYHLRSIVFISFHSWCCTFCWLGQMYNDTHSSLQYHTQYFHCWNNPQCSAYLLIPPLQPLATPDLFCLRVLPISEWHIIEMIQYVDFPDLFLSLSMWKCAIKYTLKCAIQNI